MEITDDDLMGSHKRAVKKRELAYHTLDTLAKWGYVGTSMRTISEEAGIALGTIHYYFKDKIDLICYCARLYKADFVQDLTRPLSSDAPISVLIERYVDVLTSALQDNAELHRLWFDIRAQAMFDKRFHDTVSAIEQSLVQSCETLVSRIEAKRFNATSTYTTIDGMFRYHMQMKLMGDKLAGHSFNRELTAFLTDIAK